MDIIENMTFEEKLITKKLNKYFKSSSMSLKDKVFNALLIAQHELEAQHFSNEMEKQKIIHYKVTLDNLLEKLSN